MTTHTIELIVGLAGLANIGWTFHNWQLGGKLKDQINEADFNIQHSRRLLSTCQSISNAAAIEQEHKVCSECERIVTKHTTDENGKTVCVNCAKNLASRVS